jgi:lipoprotein-releasing system permease protein
VQTVATKIKRLLPDTRPITRSEILRTYDAVFNWRSGMILTVFFAALIAFSILAWDKATGISADEKREIGILKAIGWSTSDVLELKFWEGAAISVTSFLVGLIAAFAHVFLFGAPLLARVIKGWSVVFPDFRVTPYLDLYQIFVMAFLTILPYIACTVVPSWKTAVTDPEEVMRS